MPREPGPDPHSADHQRGGSWNLGSGVATWSEQKTLSKNEWAAGQTEKWVEEEREGRRGGCCRKLWATPPVGFTHQHFLTSLPFPPLFRAPETLHPHLQEAGMPTRDPQCSPLLLCACLLRSLSLVYLPRNVSPGRGAARVRGSFLEPTTCWRPVAAQYNAVERGERRQVTAPSGPCLQPPPSPTSLSP